MVIEGEKTITRHKKGWHVKPYQNNAINTASGGELTLMLYNGCIKFIKQTINDLNEKNDEAKNKNIHQTYINPYVNVGTMDGMFLDRKK